MNRKIVIILAAILIPGGFIALIGGFILRYASRTERGRELLVVARARLPKMPAMPRFPAFFGARQQAA